MIQNFTSALVQYPTHINVILGVLGAIMVTSGLLTFYQYTRSNKHLSISKYRFTTFFVSAVCFITVFATSMHFAQDAIQNKRFDVQQTETSVVVNSNSDWLKSVEFEVVNDTGGATYLTYNNKAYSLN